MNYQEQMKELKEENQKLKEQLYKGNISFN